MALSVTKASVSEDQGPFRPFLKSNKSQCRGVIAVDQKKKKIEDAAIR